MDLFELDQAVILVILASISAILLLIIYACCCLMSMKGKFDLFYNKETGQPANTLHFENCFRRASSKKKENISED